MFLENQLKSLLWTFERIYVKYLLYTEDPEIINLKLKYEKKKKIEQGK